MKNNLKKNIEKLVYAKLYIGLNRPYSDLSGSKLRPH